MTDIMTSQNIDLSSWDTLYKTPYSRCMNEILMHMLVNVAFNSIVMSRLTVWSWP